MSVGRIPPRSNKKRYRKTSGNGRGDKGRNGLKNFFNRLIGNETGAAAGAAVSAAAGAVVAATAEREEPHGLRLFVAQGGQNAIYLVEALPTRPTTFDRSELGNIFCLDVEKFGFEQAVKWLREAKDVDPFGEDGVMPPLIVIGPGRPLRAEERAYVNTGMAPLGVRFYPGPDRRDNFKDAMTALQKDLEEQYVSGRAASERRQELELVRKMA